MPITTNIKTFIKNIKSKFTKEKENKKEKKISDTCVTEICNKHNINIKSNSVMHKDDTNWIIKKNDILTYFDKSFDDDGKWENNFRSYIYNDKRYIDWSNNYISKNNIKVPKNKLANENVIGTGNGWKHWKCGCEYHCECFHLFKQLYDTMKKRN